MISLLPYSINIVNSFCYNDMDNDGICDYLEIELYEDVVQYKIISIRNSTMYLN